MHDINEQQNLEIPEMKTEISEANVEICSSVLRYRKIGRASCRERV